jgi:hypothetical protein
MKKNNKGLAVIGLLALCVILAVGVFMLVNQSPNGDVLPNANEPSIEAAPGDLAELPAIITPVATPDVIAELPAIDTSEVKPITILPHDTDKQGDTDIQLTDIEDKPEPPELPDTAHNDDEQRDTPVDPALTNPDIEPDITPAPVEPAKPKEPASQGGSTGGKGEIYIPGFGYFKSESNGSQGSQSQLDPNHTDFDNIIGY